ncbi:MAG: 4-hydroxy-tetrahydrodipicolinate synthase [Ruminococcaceae bacterium]|nr:4-hydroxy-tetrahydrodipicolinate synthase [Oscillospiraceae bacterium]
MKKQLFTGSGVAIVTPMHEDGAVNYEALGELIEFQIGGGTDAIIICGTTGEASTMEDEEHLAVIEYCVQRVNKRVPVIAGTGSNDTRHGIMLSKGAALRGADGLLQVTPYYNKSNAAGIVQHFFAIADAAGLPVILYNVPSRTGLKLDLKVYQELAKHPLIVATKEASSDIGYIANLAALCGEELAIYSGNDDQIVPLLSLGGIGVISVLANVVPQAIHDMCHLYLSGRTQESTAMQLKYMELNNVLFSEVNPIPVKEALNLMGYAAGPCRLPLGPMGEGTREAMRQVLAGLGLLS